MKFAILTNGWDYGFRVASSLREAKIRPHIVLIKTRIMTNDIGKYFRLRTIGPTVIGGTLNSEKMIKTFQEIDPDYILIAGVNGKISNDIIKTAKFGIVNAHPGLLPWFRGKGVVARAIQNGCPVGATLHFVDDGLHTGSMFLRELMEIDPEWSLREIEKEMDVFTSDMLTDFAIVASRHYGEIPVRVTPQTKEIGKYYTKPTQEEYKDISLKVKEGSAVSVYNYHINKLWWRLPNGS